MVAVLVRDLSEDVASLARDRKLLFGFVVVLVGLLLDTKKDGWCFCCAVDMVDVDGRIDLDFGRVLFRCCFL